MKLIRKAYKSYCDAGALTRLIAKITLIVCISLLIVFLYCYFSVNNPKHYELMLLCDKIFDCFKFTFGIGFLGIIICGIFENHN